MLNKLIEEAEKKERVQRVASSKKCYHLSGNNKTNNVLHKDPIIDNGNEHEMDSTIGNVTSNIEKGVIDINNIENCKNCALEIYWEKNKHPGCTAGKNSFVFEQYAVTMTKVDVSSFNPWGMYNYYRMQV